MDSKHPRGTVTSLFLLLTPTQFIDSITIRELSLHNFFIVLCKLSIHCSWN